MNYHNNEYFNDKDFYEFEYSLMNNTFISQVKYSNGNWWTLKKPYFKASSIKSKLYEKK